MNKNILAVAFACVGLMGCGEKVETVEFYKQNPELAEEMKKKCEVGKANELNCKNADEAISAMWLDAHRYKG